MHFVWTLFWDSSPSAKFGEPREHSKIEPSRSIKGNRHKPRQQYNRLDCLNSELIRTKSEKDCTIMRYSIVIFVTLLAKSNASDHISHAVRGSSSQGGVDKMQQILNEGGCYGNNDCPDNHFCHVPDGDCFSGSTEGECYEMRASRTRSFNRVSYFILITYSKTRALTSLSLVWKLCFFLSFTPDA